MFEFHIMKRILQGIYFKIISCSVVFLLGGVNVIVLISLLYSTTVSADSVFNITIRTQAENNRNVSVWYRVPEHYREIPGRKWRAVDSAILFGAVAESAFRFPKAQITVVEPPEFCTLPSNAKLVL
jgi:hypothetical protein